MNVNGDEGDRKKVYAHFSDKSLDGNLIQSSRLCIEM